MIMLYYMFASVKSIVLHKESFENKQALTGYSISFLKLILPCYYVFEVGMKSARVN